MMLPTKWKQEGQQLKAPKQPNDVANKVEMWEGKVKVGGLMVK